MIKEQKFEKWAEKQFQQNSALTIIGDEHSGWVAFNRYHIKPVDTGYEVWHYYNLVTVFGSKKSAISYCIADFHKQYKLSQQIRVLDAKKQLVINDIKCRSEMARRGKSAKFREMVNTKLETKLAVNAAVSAELEKCISSAKYIQLRGFSNETARPSYS